MDTDTSPDTTVDDDVREGPPAIICTTIGVHRGWVSIHTTCRDGHHHTTWHHPGSGQVNEYTSPPDNSTTTKDNAPGWLMLHEPDTTFLVDTCGPEPNTVLAWPSSDDDRVMRTMWCPADGTWPASPQPDVDTLHLVTSMGAAVVRRHAEGQVTTTIHHADGTQSAHLGLEPLFVRRPITTFRDHGDRLEWVEHDQHTWCLVLTEPPHTSRA